MTKAIKPLKSPKLEPLRDIILKENSRLASVYYRNKLEEIVLPFDSRIRFVVVSSDNGRNYITNISPSQDAAGVNATGDTVTSLELFKWLDEGTDIRYVGMPEDFTRETTPNSLGTNHASYDRDDIFFLKEPTDGIEARNFLRQIDNLLRNVYRIQMTGAIDSYLRSQESSSSPA